VRWLDYYIECSGNYRKGSGKFKPISWLSKEETGVNHTPFFKIAAAFVTSLTGYILNTIQEYWKGVYLLDNTFSVEHASINMNCLNAIMTSTI
jgi:hypothetical protein